MRVYDEGVNEVITMRMMWCVVSVRMVCDDYEHDDDYKSAHGVCYVIRLYNNLLTNQHLHLQTTVIVTLLAYSISRNLLMKMNF